MDGRPIRIGNDPDIQPGPADTFMSYDLPWANASNAPFRLYKHWVHEGGISTPFIMHWPSRIRESGIVHGPAYITDIAATCIDAAHAGYPKEHGGVGVPPIEGESLLPVIEGCGWSRERPIIWEHEGNRAVRMGQWKLVSELPGSWELYDMSEDRTEMNDLAAKDPAKVDELAGLYEQWAERVGVVPWPAHPSLSAPPLKGKHAHVARYGSGRRSGTR